MNNTLNLLKSLSAIMIRLTELHNNDSELVVMTQVVARKTAEQMVHAMSYKFDNLLEDPGNVLITDEQLALYQSDDKNLLLSKAIELASQLDYMLPSKFLDVLTQFQTEPFEQI